jgi:hypothetical protein
MWLDESDVQKTRLLLGASVLRPASGSLELPLDVCLFYSSLCCLWTCVYSAADCLCCLWTCACSIAACAASGRVSILQQTVYAASGRVHVL